MMPEIIRAEEEAMGRGHGAKAQKEERQAGQNDSTRCRKELNDGRLESTRENTHPAAIPPK